MTDPNLVQQSHTIHSLKTWPEPFSSVWDGAKTYEIRKDDRSFAVGDTIILEEWDPKTSTYSGRRVMALVSHLTRQAWGLPEGLVVMCWRGYQRVWGVSCQEVQ